MITMSHNWIRMVAVSRTLRTLPALQRRLAWLALVAGLGTGAMQAAEIPVPNGSFESPSVPSGFPALPLLDNWQKSPQPIWYDPGAFGGITWDQVTGVFPNTAEGSPDHIVNLDGAQAAYMFALPDVGLSQELSATYEVGLSYTLTVGMLGSQGIAEGSTFELGLYYLDGLNAPITVASTPVTYTATGFPNGVTELVEFAVNLAEVQASDAWAGQNIGIQLLSTSGTTGVWDLDNVRLQAVPEPGTMALLAIGLGVLIAAGARTQSSRSGHR
jgi:hypothetical protein